MVSGFVLRRCCEQLSRNLPDGFGPRLALQFGVEPAVAIQVDRGQMEDAEVACYPGGLADVDFVEFGGQAGKRLRQQLFPGPAGAAVRRGEQYDPDTGRAGETSVVRAFGQA